MAIQLVLEFLQISNTSVGIGFALGGQIPEDGDSIHKAILFSTGTCGQRRQVNACHSGSHWGTMSIFQRGQPPEGRSSSKQRFLGLTRGPTILTKCPVYCC